MSREILNNDVFKRLLFWRLNRKGGSDLTRAMKRVAEADGPETRDALYKQLLLANVLLPKPGDPEDPAVGAAVMLKGGSYLRIMTTRNLEGQQVMIAFTDPGALLAWRPEGSNYIALRAQDAFSIALANNLVGVIINPRGPVGGLLTHREIVTLAEGILPKPESGETSPISVLTLPHGAKALVGAPTGENSSALAIQFGKLLETHSEISSAYLFETAIGHGKRHLALGLVFEDSVLEDREIEVIKAISGQITPAVEPGEYVDLVTLDKGHLLETVRAVGLPLIGR